MRFSKSIMVVSILFILSTIVTIYTLTAHNITSKHIYEDTESQFVYWRSGPSGSLFPWSREPGILGILLQLNETDQFIYNYLIKTRILVSISILIWLVAGFYAYKILFKRSNKN